MHLEGFAVVQTLIELYDERAIENFLGPETFLPERVIYLCPAETIREQEKCIRQYYAWRNLKTELIFLQSSIYRTDLILQQFRVLGRKYPGCVVDVTGGTDAALFAAGAFCRESGSAAFTYSRKQNCFYNISGATFAEETKCALKYRVEDFFRMTGGRMRPGRVDNRQLAAYLDQIEAFFGVFVKHQEQWNEQILFMQRISQRQPEMNRPLYAEGSKEQKGEHGKRVTGDPVFLKDLADIGWIQHLVIDEEKIAFSFADEQIRAWLRDVGSVLELYVYKACIDAGCFDDVVSSAVVDWDEVKGGRQVTNEIDAAASMGVTPLFISCKACDVKTEAINELAILRDRFGGKGAKAAIVTTERCGAAARHRAAQLSIAVIDQEELNGRHLVQRLKVIMKVASDLDDPAMGD